MMAATIKDVAKMAGVAVSTVSYALNNSPKISEGTRRKVMQAAEALNYRPSGAARNLKKRKSETIGLFLNDLGGPFYSQVIEGVQEVVASHNYNLIVCSTYGGENSSAHRFLREKFVDGAIIMGTSIPDSLVHQVAAESFPIVVLDRELKGDYVHSVLITNEQGAYDAVSHLIKLGRHKIEYLSGPQANNDNMQRYEGYKRALMEHSLPVPSRVTMQGRYLEAGGYQAVKVMMAGNRMPDAIFAANDEMAIGAIRALREGGIRVPEDVAIVGFDNINLAPFVRPALTTIGHSKYEMGAIATQLVFDVQKEGNSILLPTQLVIRQSCGFNTMYENEEWEATILNEGRRKQI
ncbi:LacI family DNA-binding transcriptional regulator [Paenibacillus sp. R14(2021)]|uniref:LacI family DNA-binding transcriptional regulator n=1 Tax=Paenibacillus sp. R14(2021) TaxID=2859228 RepID=UPI0021580B81|nr:LacI family DNA-binding transcriptional regulator [Paenibacillus sp. R14(2021)]